MDDDENERPVTAEEIATMAAEVRRGLRPSQSAVSMTADHRRIWDDLVDQDERRRR